jgi:hypothetical protein
MIFYKIDSKTTDIMKKDLSVLREKENQIDEVPGGESAGLKS